MNASSDRPEIVADAHAIFDAAVRRVQADRLLDASDPGDWAPRSLGAYDTVRVVGMGKAAMLVAMVGFVSTVAYCRFLLRGDIIE